MSKKDEQLGMDHTTAGHRLRKMLLFEFAKRLGLDKCFRCRKQLTIDDFTIDHKEPWLDVGPELFWDVNNIAFSHSKCNILAQRHVGSRLDALHALMRSRSKHLNAPEGMAWCTKHKAYFPKSRFDRDRAQANGVHARCKECRK